MPRSGSEKSGRGGRITASFVHEWSSKYSVSYDTEVLEVVHPTVSAQGYYTDVQFHKVGRWKSRRSSGYLRRNSAQDIQDITQLALGAPERLRHRVLDLLHGVGVPMASALLTIHDPGRYTVLDVRALSTLRSHGELQASQPGYWDYVQLCRKLADQAGCDLRTLDRALWCWSSEHDGKPLP